MKLFFGIGILVLIFSEMMKVYFIMPFPGSQVDETISIAYFLQKQHLVFPNPGNVAGGVSHFLLSKIK